MKYNFFYYISKNNKKKYSYLNYTNDNELSEIFILNNFHLEESQKNNLDNIKKYSNINIFNENINILSESMIDFKEESKLKIELINLHHLK
jgi:hypothetical protein